MGIEVFPIGSRIRVTNYSPFRGLRGSILTIHMIAAALDEPFCFYLVALEGTQTKEPLWFEYHEVELVAPPLVDSWIDVRSLKWLWRVLYQLWEGFNLVYLIDCKRDMAEIEYDKNGERR